MSSQLISVIEAEKEEILEPIPQNPANIQSSLFFIATASDVLRRWQIALTNMADIHNINKRESDEPINIRSSLDR